jgi:hypothetical protein
MPSVDTLRTRRPMIRNVRVKKVVTRTDHFLSLLSFETTCLPQQLQASRKVGENCALLGYCATSSSNSLQTFRRR